MRREYETPRRGRDLEYGFDRWFCCSFRPLCLFHEQGCSDYDDLFCRQGLPQPQHSLQLHFTGQGSYSICRWISEEKLSWARERNVREIVSGATDRKNGRAG